MRKRLDYADTIIENVCNYYKVTNKDIRGKSRKYIHTKPRFVAIWLIKEELGLKLTAISDMFGRNHTTIIHSLKMIQDSLSQKYDTDVSDDIKEIKKILSY
jgi:chromosomal replication initiator protein